MLKELIEGVKLEETIGEILHELHEQGPTSSLSMEKISYIKKYHNMFFQEYEKQIVALMGLFYKSGKPKNVIEEFYSTIAETIKDKTGHNFSPTQASAYLSIKNKTFFSFSAPTSSGKSHLFRTLIRESKGDVIIIVPSRALVAEYLHEVYSLVDNSVLVLQFIDNINTSKITRRVFIITPERGVELFKRVADFNVELFLFDESHLSDDTERGMNFDSFIRRVNKVFPYAKKVFAHPFVNNPEAQLKKHNIENDALSKNYQQLTVGKIFISQKNREFKHFSPNKRGGELCQMQIDPVQEGLKDRLTLLVYISKSKIYDDRYLNEFRSYVDLCPKITNRDALEMIEKLRLFIGADKENSDKTSQMIEMMKRGIVIHHGSIPLKARLIIEEFVKANFARICFSTSTLSQGINMPFDIVWIDNFNSMDTITLKNLIGRSGRTSKEKDTFDYGYTIVNDENRVTFSKRFKKAYQISEKSLLDRAIENMPIDVQDKIEAIKTDTFNDELHLPQSQVNRLATPNLDADIKYILDKILENSIPLSGTKYTELEDTEKNKIKESLKNIYVLHLRRNELTTAEMSVLSASIPILLWHIQGRSFSEATSLRFAYLSQKKERMAIERNFKEGKITKDEEQKYLNSLKVLYSPEPSQLPNIRLRKFPAFPRMLVKDLKYDRVVYDTYDYLDKVISFSLIDPICAALDLYHKRNNDVRAKSLINYIRYGTDNPDEIMLMRYGFSFEDIEWIKEHIISISEEEIIFAESISNLTYDQRLLIDRYL